MIVYIYVFLEKLEADKSTHPSPTFPKTPNAIFAWMFQEVCKRLANGFITPIYPAYRWATSTFTNHLLLTYEDILVGSHPLLVSMDKTQIPLATSACRRPSVWLTPRATCATREARRENSSLTEGLVFSTGKPVLGGSSQLP